MTQSGYIPIPRHVFQEGFWQVRRKLSHAEAELWLYANASYAERTVIINHKPIQLQPGQLAASYRFLMEAWQWDSLTKVGNHIANLEKQGRITTETRTGQTVITISFLSDCEAPKDTERTAKGHGEDSKRTAKGHGEDKTEIKNKEIKNKEGATPAPLFNENMSTIILPSAGTAFEMLKRIGKPAAQIWTQVEAEKLFADKADLALEWMELRCRFGKPFISHQEFTALAKLYAAHSYAEIRSMIEYSAGKYPNLYPDRLTKNQKQTSSPAKIIDNSKFDKYRNPTT